MHVYQSSFANTNTAQASCYRAELCSPLLDDDGALIDWLIGFAFDTLGASRLELRVTAPETCEQQGAEAA